MINRIWSHKMPSKKNVAQLDDLKNIFSKAIAIYFTKYQGLNVATITNLRGSFFKNNIDYKVAKNTLIKIVLDKYPPPDVMVAETIDVPALFIVVLLPVIEITVGLVRTL